MNELNHAHSAASHLSRRRGPRVNVRDTVSARTTSSAFRIVAVRDLGFRGFAIETDVPVLRHSKASFEFFSGSTLLFAVDAVAVHCFYQPGSKGVYVSGWEFPEFAGLEALVEKMMHEAVGELTIE